MARKHPIITIDKVVNKRGGSEKSLPHNSMVRPAGFEPATYGLEVRCSIQLSYERTIL